MDRDIEPYVLTLTADFEDQTLDRLSAGPLLSNKTQQDATSAAAGATTAATTKKKTRHGVLQQQKERRHNR